MSEYYRMPKLYGMDDFDQCMEREGNLSVYCIARITIKPDESLDLWNYIEEFSRNRKKHFRHDRLQRGVCINRCKELMHPFAYSTQMSYFQPEFEFEDEVRQNFYRQSTAE